MFADEGMRTTGIKHHGTSHGRQHPAANGWPPRMESGSVVADTTSALGRRLKDRSGGAADM
jgi:hypothetical protein